MKEKIPYKKIEKADKPKNGKNGHKAPTKEKFSWNWHPIEKKILITLMSVLWGGCFLDYLIMNQKLSNEIQGLGEGSFGFKRDNYDSQWNDYRDNLPLIVLVGSFHLLGAHLVKRYLKDSRKDEPNDMLLNYHLVFGMGILVYMFEAGLIFWFILVTINYFLGKLLRSYSFYEPFLWCCTLLTLYFNETYHGYRFDWIHPSLEFLDKSAHEAPAHWNVMFNMTILRLMSFCIDFSWATREKRGLSIQEHEKKCKVCTQTVRCYKSRQETTSPLHYYNFRNYLAFLVYPPLFISGPVTTFNAWISQIKTPQNTYTQKQVYKYVLRTCLDYVCFEIFLHLFYVCALSTNPVNEHIWKNFSLKNLGIMSFLELIFLWFKFLLIWRIPRCWAFLDGIEVPENMNRCMCNNYTFEGFWRSWHRGFNQWLIRYLFIPLGGTKYKFYNIWVVFSFVALWHDMNINLLVWAMGICIALMPEMFLKWYFFQPKFKHYWNQPWFRYMCGLGAGVDILLMVSANLVGFGIGWNGALLVLNNFLNLEGAITLTGMVLVFTLLGLVLFMIRENEDEAEKGF